jgi:hypothetical protein
MDDQEDQMPAPEREYLSPADLSAIFGATPQLWRRLVLSGEVKGYRLGETLIRVRREDAEAYLLSRPITGPVAVRDGRRKGKKPGPKPGSRRGAAR